MPPRSPSNIKNLPKDYDSPKLDLSAYKNCPRLRSQVKMQNLISDRTFSSSQMQFVEDAVEQRLLQHEVEFGEFFNNLQLEMMGQFMIQKDEIVHELKTKFKNDLDPYLQ